MVYIQNPSVSNSSNYEAFSFLVVEERPLLEETEATILASMASFILLVGVLVQVRIFLILTNSHEKITVIEKLFLTNCIVSLICHPPLLIYNIANALYFPISDFIGLPGCVILLLFLDVFIRIFGLFFPLSIVTLRYVFVVHNLWVKRHGINR